LTTHRLAGKARVLPEQVGDQIETAIAILWIYYDLEAAETYELGDKSTNTMTARWMRSDQRTGLRGCSLLLAPATADGSSTLAALSGGATRAVVAQNPREPHEAVGTHPQRSGAWGIVWSTTRFVAEVSDSDLTQGRLCDPVLRGVQRSPPAMMTVT
jgi:hypothetical protein